MLENYQIFPLVLITNFKKMSLLLCCLGSTNSDVIHVTFFFLYACYLNTIKLHMELTPDKICQHTMFNNY